MRLTYCDICEQIIKDGDDKFLITAVPIKHNDKENGFKGFYEELSKVGNRVNYNQKIIIKEICVSCLKVYGEFIKLRGDKLRKMKEELKLIEDATNKQENSN